MNKKIISFVIVLFLTVSLVSAFAGLNKEQRAFYNECKKNCSTTKMQDKRECNLLFFECKSVCREAKINNSNEYKENYKGCVAECSEINQTDNLTRRELNQLKNQCRRNCSEEHRNQRKNSYEEYRQCSKTCQEENFDCNKQANEDFWLCRDNCEEQEYVPEEPEIPINDSDDNETEDKVFCPKLRPHVCTEQYEPVCSNKGKTYDNGCFACSDRTVRWYTQGACEESV